MLVLVLVLVPVFVFVFEFEFELGFVFRARAWARALCILPPLAYSCNLFTVIIGLSHFVICFFCAQVYSVSTDTGRYATVLLVNGLPAIVFYDATAGSLLIIRSLNAQGSSWGSPVVIDK